MFHKGEKERVLAYSVHAACDKKGFVLSSIVSAANVHDSVVFKELYENVKSKFTEISAVAVDSGYKTPYICKILLDDNVTPVMPYKRPMTKKGFFKKHDFVYDEYYDCYICPKEEILTYSTTNREGYKEYVSNPQVCLKCEFLHKCTCSKNNKKVVCRHVWEEYLEEAEHLRHTTYNKSIYALRSQTIERVFADLKEKHGLCYTTLRGIDKVRMQTLLAFACLNLKKLANWK
ncbi:transposase [Alkalithermobacter thermoalcaliphilus JW-YL-7 = DSM 7308]|uniref:Transposase n=1 Tax=Alkalithermobacter thermoalcaliphilus JW-YL-7 = DSM 7308 TaxID=1121328 RepID=A0A150FQX3_CLOPD|nr:transposase [[Clostridium] paradoxum JW-YL-7 = DSM 7308]